MDIRFLFLILTCLFTCRTPPSPSPPEPAPVQAVEPATWPPDGWFPRTVADTAQLQAHIAKQLDAVVAKVETTDPALATDLRTKVAAFRGLTPSMIVDETPDHDPIFAADGCTESCERFVAEDMIVVAVWQMGLLGVNFRAINSEYTPYIIFHELYHRNDPTANNITDADRIPGVPNPWETNAWNYQSRVVNAATGGRYQTLIRGWMEGVRRGVIPSVTVLNTVNAEVPRDFRSLLNGDLGNSDLCLQGFAFMLEYDLNREIIVSSAMSAADRAQAEALLYNNLNAAPVQSNEAATLVRESMRSWRR